MSKVSSAFGNTSSTQHSHYPHQHPQGQQLGQQLSSSSPPLSQVMSVEQGNRNHQSYYMPSTSAHSMHHIPSQSGMINSNHQLSLEDLHEQLNRLEYVGLDSLTYNTPQPQVLGVGQGPGNTEPRYTAPTATALAAHAHAHNGSNTFIFGQDMSSQHHPSNTSPGSVSSTTSPFSSAFSFVASTPGSLSSHLSDVQEHLSPHESLTSHTSNYPVLQGYPQHQPSHPGKRARLDPHDPYGDGSGEEDDYGLGVGTSYGYNGYGFTSLPGVDAQGQSSHQPVQSSSIQHNSTEQSNLPNHQVGPDGRPKQACVRCKNLKVRCEFTTDPHSCRRCLNGGHECAIPGRKKRRQPPKREHLLNKIREQASEIEQLMKQVEELRKHAAANGPQEPLRLSLSNTPLPGGSGIFASTGRSASASGSALGTATLGPDLQAWLERSRAVFQEICGFIDEETIEEEGEDDDVDGETYREHRQEESEDEGSISVEDPDGMSSPVPSSLTSVGSQIRESSPASTVRSVSREGSSAPDSTSRKRGSGKTPRLAPLPSTAAEPMKLIAQLSLRSDGHRERGSKSPRSASGTIVSSRSGSVEPSSASGLNAVSPTLQNSVTDVVHRDNDTEVKEKTEEGNEDFGAAAPEFFVAQGGTIPDSAHLAPARHPIPHILMRNIINVQEVEKLFKIYFEKMNLSCSLLDPILYTEQTTYWRSPLLFTVICAVASRYYTERPGLYDQLITYAQLAAGTALISGPKTVETVSAYILLSLYPVPMRRWEEDRTWLYLGLAIRVATDLNLHHQIKMRPKNEMHARELLNRTRVWTNCFNLDRSTSSWLGKRSTIPANDFVGCHTQDWYDANEFNLKNFDIHLAGYNCALRLLEEFKRRIYTDSNNPTGLDKRLDFSALASEYDGKLSAREAEWAELLREKTDVTDPQARFRNSLLRLAYRYARLVVLSYGFQHSFDKDSNGSQDQTSFFDRCYRAATEVLRVFIEELSTQKVYIRHGPEAQCVFVTFASAFLIKLLHPKYATYLKVEQRHEIDKLVRGLIGLLGSPEVVVDEKHSPKLWSRFLSGLLSTPTAKIELSSDHLKKSSSLSRRGARKSLGPPSDSPEGQVHDSISNLVSSGPNDSDHMSSLPGYPQEIGPCVSISNDNGTYSSPSLPVQVDQDQYSSGHNRTVNPVFDVATGQLSQFTPQGLQDTHGIYNLSSHSAIPNLGSPIGNTHSAGGMFDAHTHAGTDTSHHRAGMNIPEYFEPPLQFDTDLLESMQSMPDSSLCQYMTGFAWMGGMLQSTDADTNMQDVFISGPVGYGTSALQGASNHY